MTMHTRNTLSSMLFLAIPLVVACTSAAPEPHEVAASSAALVAADGAAAAVAPAAIVEAPLSAAEISARATAGVESADQLTGAARKQYFEAQREAARKALALQRRALQRAEQGRRDRAAQGADQATLTSIDTELGQLKSRVQNLETKLQTFEQNAATARL